MATTKATTTVPSVGYCEFCGDGPTCCVCGRGLYEVFDPKTGDVVFTAGSRDTADLLAEVHGLDFAPAGQWW